MIERHGSHIPPRLLLAFAISMLFHAAVLVIVERTAPREIERALYRVTLKRPRRWRAEPRFQEAGPAVPKVRMERLEADGAPEGAFEIKVSGPGVSAPVFGPAVSGRELRVELGAVGPAWEGADAEQPISPSEAMRVEEAPTIESELVRIEDLARADGHKAMVIIDTEEKRNVRGYLNLARIRLRGAGTAGPGVVHLMRYLKDRTGIVGQVKDAIHLLRTPEVLRHPILFLFQGGGLPTGTRSLCSVKLDDREMENLGRYLREGGFLFVEGDNCFLREVKDRIREALRPHGRLFKLPSDHPLYGVFYDFEAGAPGEERSPTYVYGDDVPVQPWWYPREKLWPLGLWGVELEGRLVAILSDLALLTSVPGDSTDGLGRHLQFGVNLVVYALTQPGGLTPKGYDGRLPPDFQVVRHARTLRDDVELNELPRLVSVMRGIFRDDRIGPVKTDGAFQYFNTNDLFDYFRSTEGYRWLQTEDQLAYRLKQINVHRVYTKINGRNGRWFVVNRRDKGWDAISDN